MKKDNYINQAKYFFEKGWDFKAALELGSHLEINGGVISMDLISPLLNQLDWSKIESESKSQIEKAINILSFGSVWDEDEILLVFSIMLNIYLIEKVYSYYSLDFNLNVNKIKEQLRGVFLMNNKNQKAINSAAKMLDKHSDIKSWKSIIEYDKLVS
jgi:vacuolar-type H+-ATPase catalytic subunit A/Vma1